MQYLSRPCGISSCSPYSWQAGTLGACSADCGVGIARREIYCVFNGQRVDLSFCQNMSAPPLQQETCYLKPCPAASWNLSPWSPCSQGSETRNVSCTAPNGTTLDDLVSFHHCIGNRCKSYISMSIKHNCDLQWLTCKRIVGHVKLFKCRTACKASATRQQGIGPVAHFSALARPTAAAMDSAIPQQGPALALPVIRVPAAMYSWAPAHSPLPHHPQQI